MRHLSAFLCVFLTSFLALAQSSWNWPEDQTLKDQVLTHEAYYKVLMAEGKLGQAMKSLNWLYTNHPELNPSVYINGAKNLNNIIKSGVDEDRKERLQDSILWMYDMRIKHFENDAATLDRKVFEAFKMYYKTPMKYGLLAELFDKAYELNGPKISYFNLNPYMMLATNYYKTNPTEMPAEQVLDIHIQISDIIDQQKKNGGSVERLNKEQGKVDGFLGSISDILSCQFIEDNLVPKFREIPSDISTAKKIFKYSVKAKCTDKTYFLEASETVFKSQPSFELARTMGNKYLGSKEYAKAMEYHAEALELAETNEEKAEALLGQAIASSKKGDKSQARGFAYESLSLKPNDPDAYNLIGNMYFTSFNECQGGESKVLDRSVFLAAYKMYERAENKAQMQASKEQFPSIEDIFNENYEEGQTITAGCWISEIVIIMRR